MSHAEELHHYPPRLTSNAGAAQAHDLDRVVRRAREGDHDAFHLLYRNVQPRLLRYARTLVGDDAEDVAAEAWLQIAEDIRSFRGDMAGFRGWAATIVRHRALDHLRYHRRRPVDQTPTGELPEQAATDDTAIAALDVMSTRAALALVAQLPREQAEIIMLRVVIGLDVKAVARIVGKRAGAVRTATHRGLRQLEHVLKDLERRS